MTNRSRRGPGGFTLLELLVVVAIIAVLAAIAVPNFLEAQTRAKVSRVKSDLRTIASALEVYRLDCNGLPPQAPRTHTVFPFARDHARVYGGDSPGHAPGNPPIAFPLSTPVAYLTSTSASFGDPFFAGHGEDELSGPALNFNHSHYNWSGDYLASHAAGPFLTLEKAVEWRNKSGWHLRSRGPDRNYSTSDWGDAIAHQGAARTGKDGAGGINAFYDPSNGTISSGDIVRFGLGGQM